MSLRKDYVQCLTESQAESVWDVQAEIHIMLTNHQGGTWTLSLVAPDDTEIPLCTFNKNGEQRLRMGMGRLKLSGGTAGARAYFAHVPTLRGIGML